MLNPARANSWIVASWSDPFGIPSLSVAIRLSVLIRVLSVAICGQLPEEARSFTGVADVAIAETLHLEQDRVLVAIDAHLGHLQPVAGGLPLHPQLVARSAEEGGKPRRSRPLERLVVHET